MGKKIKILLMEDNLKKRLEFKSCIQFNSNFEICGETGSEREGLQLLKKTNADIVILDLELEEGNGVLFAEKMRNLSIRQPFVIVTTYTCSSAIFHYLRNELRIDFICQKTNASYSAEQVMDLVEKVYKYHNTANPDVINEKERLKNRIYHILQNIGFSSNHVGTDYLVAALLFISEHREDTLQLSKIIYPAIAKQYHNDPSNIEKAIRTSIEKAWNGANVMTLFKHYPYEIGNKNGRPSNGEFIANMKLTLFGS